MFRQMNVIKALTGLAVGALAWTGYAVSAAPTTAPSEKPYPLSVCVVSGEKLGAMGKPAVIEHEGRTVKLCCAGCIGTFRDEPAKYLKKLDDAEKSPATQPATQPSSSHGHGHAH